MILLVITTMGLSWTPPPREEGYIDTFLPKFEGGTMFTRDKSYPYLDSIEGGAKNGPPDTYVCDCTRLREPQWKSEDDLSYDTRKCRRPRYGWTWSLSAPYTEPIVMSMDPGQPRPVEITGADSAFYQSANAVYGQPCGIVTQDALGGRPIKGNGGFALLPSTVPVSLYCSPYPHSGNTSDPKLKAWSGFIDDAINDVKRVCECSEVSAVDAILEYSGVYPDNPHLQSAQNDTNYRSDLKLATISVVNQRQQHYTNVNGWNGRSSTIPGPPKCRDDYVLYYLLLLAYESVHNTSHPLHGLIDSPTFSSGSDTWQSYYLHGVDCQSNIETDMDCGEDTYKYVDVLRSNPYIVNQSYIVGFNVTDLMSDLNSLGHTTQRSMWDVVKMYRRGVSLGLKTPGCPSEDYVNTRPTTYCANSSYPIFDEYEYMFETLTLFVRRAFFGDYSTATSGLFYGIETTPQIPGILGSECSEWMLNEGYRLVAAPQAKEAPKCDHNQSPDVNYRRMKSKCFNKMAGMTYVSNPDHIYPSRITVSHLCGCKNLNGKPYDIPTCGNCKLFWNDVSTADIKGEGYYPASIGITQPTEAGVTKCSLTDLNACLNDKYYGWFNYGLSDSYLDLNTGKNYILNEDGYRRDKSIPKSYVQAVSEAHDMWLHDVSGICCDGQEVIYMNYCPPNAPGNGGANFYRNLKNWDIGNGGYEGCVNYFFVYYGDDAAQFNIGQQIAVSCVRSSKTSSAPIDKANYVGNTIPPLVSLPRLRGMMPTPLITRKSDGTPCTLDDIFNSGQDPGLKNKCTFGVPRAQIVGDILMRNPELSQTYSMDDLYNSHGYEGPLNEYVEHYHASTSPDGPTIKIPRVTMWDGIYSGNAIYDRVKSAMTNGDISPFPITNATYAQHVASIGNDPFLRYITVPNTRKTVFSDAFRPTLGRTLVRYYQSRLMTGVGDEVYYNETTSGIDIQLEQTVRASPGFDLTRNNVLGYSTRTVPPHQMNANRIIPSTAVVPEFGRWCWTPGGLYSLNVPYGSGIACMVGVEGEYTVNVSTLDFSYAGFFPTSNGHGGYDLPWGTEDTTLNFETEMTYEYPVWCNSTGIFCVYVPVPGQAMKPVNVDFKFYVNDGKKWPTRSQVEGTTINGFLNGFDVNYSSTLKYPPLRTALPALCLCIESDVNIYEPRQLYKYSNGTCTTTVEQSGTAPTSAPTSAPTMYENCMDIIHESDLATLRAIAASRISTSFDGFCYTGSASAMMYYNLYTGVTSKPKVEPDVVHCEESGGDIFEKTSYFKTGRGGSAFSTTATHPDGLTSEALSIWCNQTTECGNVSSIYHRVCMPFNESPDPTAVPIRITNTSKPNCVLRKRVGVQYTDIHAHNEKNDAELKTTMKFAPSCLDWVDGIDPDSWCMGSGEVFTGCVLVDVLSHESSLLPSPIEETGGYMFDFEQMITDGVIDGVTTVNLSVSDIDSNTSNAYNQCWKKTSCDLYNFVSLNEDGSGMMNYSEFNSQVSIGDVREKYMISNTTTTKTVCGIVGGYSSGFTYPEHHLGPRISRPTPALMAVYKVTGLYLFGDDPGSFKNPFSVKYHGLKSGEIGIYEQKFDSCSVVPRHMIGAPSSDFEDLVHNASVCSASIPGGIHVFGETSIPRIVKDDNDVSTITTIATGLRLSIRSGGSLRIYKINYDSDQNSTYSVPSDKRRYCVPLTERYVVNSTTFNTEASEYNIRRTSPINCATLSSAKFEAPIPDIINKNGGCCYEDQLLEWPSYNEPHITSSPTTAKTAEELCESETNAAKYSSLSTYSRWFDHNESSDGVLTLFRDDEDGLMCSSSSSSCSITIDRTAFVPCTGNARNTWFTCMNPIMTKMYPMYPPEEPSVPSTEFERPMDLYTSNEDNANKFTAFRWTQFVTGVHYCSKFMYDGATTVDASGWPIDDGKFIGCVNDPMTLSGRQTFCETKKPWLVLTGDILKDLELSDICPFLKEPALPERYCVVFSDGRYNTVGSILSQRIPSEGGWAATHFYYAPFTLQSVRMILLNPAVINTLFTLSVDAGVDVEDPLAGLRVPLNKTNLNDFSSTIEYFGSRLLNNNTNETLLGTICDDNEIISLEAWREMYKVVESFNNGDGYYTFPSTDRVNDDSTKDVPDSFVHQSFQEINTLLEYSDVRVSGLVPGIKTIVGGTPPTVENSIPICTRFQVDGDNIMIHDLVFDQSRCNLINVLEQTPIVFSGAKGSDCVIYNIEVIDTAAAVGVLGGDDLVYRSFGTIDVSGMLIYNVSFSYPSGSNIDRSLRHTVAVFGHATGDPFVASCTQKNGSGSATVLPNCFTEEASIPMSMKNCGLPGECIELGGCCGQMDAEPTSDAGCGYGARCLGTIGDLPIEFPNSRSVCNSERVGRSTRYFNGTSPLQYRPWDLYSNTINPAENITNLQQWQYNASSTGRWYMTSGSIDVKGIGLGKTVWTVDLVNASINQNLKGVPVRWGEVPLSGEIITVVPASGCGVDCKTYDRNIELRLSLNSIEYSDEALMRNLRDEWCVTIDYETNKVVLDLCNVTSLKWVLDGLTSRIHVSGSPFMCVTKSDEGHLRYLPCEPCNIGAERVILPTTIGSGVQLLSYRKFEESSVYYVYYGTTMTNFYEIPLPGSFSMVSPIVYSDGNDGWVGLIFDDDERCLTFYSSSNYSFQACDPSKFLVDVREVCDEHPESFISGFLQFVCTLGSGGSLRRVELTPSDCDLGDPHACVLEGGIGAAISVNGEVEYEGFGYMNNQKSQCNGCTIFMYTDQVLIQPISAFDLFATRVDVVNMTEFTGFFGDVYEASVYNEKMNLDGGLTVMNIILITIDFSLFVLIVLLIFYEDRLKQMVESGL